LVSCNDVNACNVTCPPGVSPISCANGLVACGSC
jgi:hypothetical protein